ncbi:YbjP/YqhG family protein [Polymorphobacter sp. PAMC 29334]|uniref:DUF3828 domain-containing protein n=1 Tax=Polymorphobacter sp. PAMC 29334 TaxID=2862331 RepID=UPI001C67C423|nr:DUF3828 domain-containing protein [Polymorphobacter sp. PAMC 29334]QYE33865.1 YbjP/YqhG family protein [Polymorphobacter sp. PAMC 29334]
MIRALLAATMLLAAPVLAAEATPTTFVTALYHAYDKPDADPLGRGAGKVFSPSLLALVRAARAPNGEVGKLDFDPICACQDADGLRLLSVTTKHVFGKNANVVSKFRISATERVVDLTLIKTTAGWRVDDVSSAGVGSLRRLLADSERKR